jgi:hypothetical protein
MFAGIQAFPRGVAAYKEGRCEIDSASRCQAKEQLVFALPADARFTTRTCQLRDIKCLTKSHLIDLHLFVHVGFPRAPGIQRRRH